VLQSSDRSLLLLAESGPSSHGCRVRPQERYSLGDAPKGDGLRLGDDLLATPQGVARGWGVGEAAPPLARSSRGGRPDRLEHTLAWLSKYRRLTIRYERRDDIHEAFLHLGCSLICFNYLS